MPRPPIQHHKIVHTIALSPETEELLEKLIDRYTLVKGVRAGSRVIAALASHPGGLIVLGTIAAYFGLRIGGAAALQEAGEDIQVSFWQGIAGIGGADDVAKAEIGEVIREGNRLARQKRKEIPILGPILDPILSGLGF